MGRVNAQCTSTLKIATKAQMHVGTTKPYSRLQYTPLTQQPFVGQRPVVPAASMFSNHSKPRDQKNSIITETNKMHDKTIAIEPLPAGYNHIGNEGGQLARRCPVATTTISRTSRTIHIFSTAETQSS